MKENLRGAIWRLAIFMVVCALGLFAMLAIFAQLRFGEETAYRAQFQQRVGAGERQLRPHRRRRGRPGSKDLDPGRRHRTRRIQRRQLGGADRGQQRRSSATRT